MKKILLSIIVLSAVFASCRKDDVDLYDVRDEYTGDYFVSDSCNASNSAYSISIYKDDFSDDEIFFDFPGLYEVGQEVHAIVTGMKIVIPIQQFYISDFPEIFYEFTGNGSLEDSVLTVSYSVITVQDGLIIDENECTATMVK